MINNEYKLYIKKIKIKKILKVFLQVFIFISFFIIWQILSNKKIINSFLFSNPKRIINCIINLYKEKSLFIHIYITLKEIVICFLIGSFLSILIASILWYFPFISEVLDPYLTIINSLPKVALGPIIIIWAGANIYSIILMSLLISVISSIINIYTSFLNTNINRIKLYKSFKSSKLKILFHVIIPSNLNNIICNFKINLSMCFVGTIMGEFLVSKQGLGYLINYGSQVFNTDLIMSGILLLSLLTTFLYLLIIVIEKLLLKKTTYYN